MKQAGLIGYPLGHSLSPAIHNAAYGAMGLDLHYEAWSTPPEEVEAAVDRFRDAEDVVGMQVTVPHKQTVMLLLDEIDDTAKAIGAVNTIQKRGGRLIGHNTDKAGYIRALLQAGCPIKGKSVLILGYGGAERAIAYGLAEAGVSSIAVSGRRPDGVAQALEHLRATSPFPMNLEAVPYEAAELDRACAGIDVIVNCTPIGMRHHESEGASPLPGEMIRPGTWVSDAVYNPLETALLRLARERGAQPVDGLNMLIYQAAEAIQMWTGSKPPVDIMRDAALRALQVQE